jgi:hypothetical protein
MTAPKGPVDDGTWPLDLTARVVDEMNGAPRIHGYDVHDDLARHFSFAEVVLTSLSGVAPTEDAGRAFEAALTFLSPASIAHAPAHAASLAQMCGGRPSGVLGVACLGLAEQGRALVDSHADLLAWLADPKGTPPASAHATSDDDRRAVTKLRALIAPFVVPGIDADLSLAAATLAVLFACGLRVREAIEPAILIARVACATAEAFAVKPAAFREYPMNNPPFRYEAHKHPANAHEGQGDE